MFKVQSLKPAQKPSSLYRSEFWKLGVGLARMLPRRLCALTAQLFAHAYWLMASHRRKVVIENLLPACQDDRAVAAAMARSLFRQFALKLVDLWRYEAGLPIEHLFGESSGWEHFEAARQANRGVLLVTPHLGNWEFGAPWLAQRGVALQVISMAEPTQDFTALRRAHASAGILRRSSSERIRLRLWK